MCIIFRTFVGADAVQTVTVADPHHFNADPDPDPAFHCNAYANPATHQCDGHLRPLIYTYSRPSQAPL